MKIKSLLYTSLAATLFFTSCDLNKEPVFDDNTQAFIAFEKVAATTDEAKAGETTVLEASLYCASVAGIDATVAFSFDGSAYGDAAAVEGTHFEPLYVVRYSIDYNNQSADFMKRINVDTVMVTKENRTIKFDKQHPYAAVAVRTIDNTQQEPNKKFDIVLSNPTACQLGANKTFTVTIADDENPMNRILGEYAATAKSGFTGYPDENWDVTISADEEKENQIWIHPICLFGGLGAGQVEPVYAKVDVVQQTVQMPYGQSLYAGNPDIKLADFNMSYGGNALANYTMDDTGVVITWTSGLVVPVPGGEGSAYQAVQPPTFTKK